MKNIGILIFLGLLITFGCKRASEGSKKGREQIKFRVEATVETTPTPQTAKDDSADDPAIWIDTSNPQNSIIIGTDKKGGLATYDLSGQQLHYFKFGKMNNCDLRYDFFIDGDTIDVLAASNRTTQSISLYKILNNGMLEPIHSRIINSAMTEEVYGLCMYKSKVTHEMYVFVNSKAGEVEQYKLFAKDHKIDAERVRTFQLNSQTEGMVADGENGTLYIGEEAVGIWKYDAEPSGLKTGKLIAGSSEENQYIKFDIEGLAIYDTGNGNGYLIASSQGNYSYAIFERQGENSFIGSFIIRDGKIDGVEETDGLDATNKKLPGFEKGFLIVQDGYNYEGKSLVSQNFKVIPWTSIEEIIQKMENSR
ncbi:MAG: phytase [Bacteroidota bacterium]